MSDKPKRNTEIEEIVAECTSRNGDCARKPDGTKCKCAYLDFFCTPLRAQGRRPSCLDLTDPPRFTEAQMAFLRGWYGMGATTIERYGCSGNVIIRGETVVDAVVYNGSIVRSLMAGETLDLAELFGKEARDAN